MSLTIEGFAPLLQVFDMPTSVAFYRDVLGFELVETSPLRGVDDSIGACCAATAWT
jgi:catechol 2,3-dioxygenase-like lactoylglutathione lyase family enzyme